MTEAARPTPDPSARARVVLDDLVALVREAFTGLDDPRDLAAWELVRVAAAFAPAPATAAALLTALEPELSPARAGVARSLLLQPDEVALAEARGWRESPQRLLKDLMELDRARGTRHAVRYRAIARRAAAIAGAGALELDRWELVVREAEEGPLRTVARRSAARDLALADALNDALTRSVDEIERLARGLDLRRRPRDWAAPPALEELVGMSEVKLELRRLANLVRVQALRREHGLPTQETTKHLVFTGNPGTGKTTVARILAGLYRELGVVSRGHLVETDRAGLVGAYVGHTALKVKGVFRQALGGVLFVDEAYALTRDENGNDPFGREAVDTLVKLMEDHRDDVVVIVAGYPREMERFVSSNPGLRSRFKRTLHFPDYANDELAGIFGSLCDAGGYRAPARTLDALEARIGREPRGKGFGNGRWVRNLFEAALAAQADRIMGGPPPTREDLRTLEPEDVEAST